MAYRETRNIEASLIEFIEAGLTADGWTGISTSKVLDETYKNLPCILVQVSDQNPVTKEVGSKLKVKYHEVSIRIFATTDGQRMDLADWLFDRLNENKITYYAFTITNGVVSAQVDSGSIVIFGEFVDFRRELVNTENLDNKDRFRHLLKFNCYVAS